MISIEPPFPPTDLNTRQPRIAILESTIFYRFYSRVNEPIVFDRSIGGRLNSPDGSFGVLYAAHLKKGAFAETFLRTPGRRLLPQDLIRKKGLVRLRSTRALQVVELHGPGLAVLGATAEVIAELDRRENLDANWFYELLDHYSVGIAPK